MKKILFLTILLILTTALHAEEIGIITAKSGLNLRSGPSTSDKIIKTIPYNTVVHVRIKGKAETIGNITSHWYSISTLRGAKGWLFGGFLKVYDATKLQHIIDAKLNTYPMMAFSACTEDGKYLWGEILGEGQQCKYIFRFNLHKKTFQTYPVSHLKIAYDFWIYYHKQKVIYSEFPTQLSGSELKKWQKKKKKISLYLYDLKTKKRRLIAVSFGKQFYPKWINSNRIEYKDPKTDKRIRIDI